MSKCTDAGRRARNGGTRPRPSDAGTMDASGGRAARGVGRTGREIVYGLPLARPVGYDGRHGPATLRLPRLHPLHRLQVALPGTISRGGSRPNRRGRGLGRGPGVAGAARQVDAFETASDDRNTLRSG